MITVIMTVHKWRDELPQAVESVLTQTYSNLELIVGMHDPRIVDYFTENVTDPRVVVRLWPRHYGFSESLEELVTLARGDYVTLIHDDDYYMPTYLETLLTEFAGDPKKYVFVSSGFTRIDGDGGRTHSAGTQPLACLHQSVLFSKFYIDRLRERDGYVWDQNWETSCESDFLYRMLELGPAKHHNDWLYMYRTSTSSYRSFPQRFRHFMEAIEASRKRGTHRAFRVVLWNFINVFMWTAHYAGITWNRLSLSRVRQWAEQLENYYR